MHRTAEAIFLRRPTFDFGDFHRRRPKKNWSTPSYPTLFFVCGGMLPCAIGDRVVAKGRSRTRYRGTVRYIGCIPGKESKGTFVGIELRAPHGTNDGRGLFSCKPKHGLFVQPAAIVEVLGGDAQGRAAPAHGKGTVDGIQRMNKFTGGAAQSHLQNEGYMEEFEKGFKALQSASSRTSEGKQHSRARPVNSKSSTSSEAKSIAPGVGWHSLNEQRAGQKLSANWYKGPRIQEGKLFDASPRNVLCMDVLGDQCVLGSADHGLKEFNMVSGRQTRELYSKQSGHTEWVTCVSYLPDGRVLSGGMDSKLCLWGSRGRQCQDLLGHGASISSISVSSDGSYAISTSYDKTLRIWSMRSGRGSQSACLSGHKAPVLHLAWAPDGPGHIVTGDRSGCAVIWDVNKGTTASKLLNHRGHVTALSWLPGGQQCITGDQAGTIRVWDVRDPQACVHEAVEHPGGAVNDIVSTGIDTVVTTGADRQIQVLDVRRSFDRRWSFDHHRDFVYSLDCHQEVCVSGGGDGLLLVHDISKGKLLYGLGANEGAVRCIAALPQRLVAAGDDGNALVWDM